MSYISYLALDISLYVMCSCIDVEMGSYDNQVEMTSWWNGSIVCVDECLWKEIHYLWDNKVVTTGCCCGHNKVSPMINVRNDFHDTMVALGYEFWENEFGVVCYVPLSI